MHERRRDERGTRLGHSPRNGRSGREDGMEFVEFSVDRCVATMPVEGNTQPVGLMHGGAYVVLGESLGSMAANLHAGAGRLAVGVDINATHTRSATSGVVTGVCTPVHLGRQHHRARDRGDRRSGATLLHDPHHQHDQGPSRRALSGFLQQPLEEQVVLPLPRDAEVLPAPSRCARSRFLAARSGSRGCAPVWPPAADGVPVPCASTR